VGALRQNVHGVTDLFGRRKPSYASLREECSPVESLTAENRVNAFHLRVKTRHDFPMYALRGYKLRGVFYGEGDVPIERQEAELPEIIPGGEITVDLALAFSQTGVPLHVTFDVLRPTGFSACSRNWKP
jgi:beta-galactosidase